MDITHLFTLLSFDGYLSNFHFWCIIKMLLRERLCLWIFLWKRMFSVLLDINLRIEFLGHTIILRWIFSKNVKLFSKWLYHFTVPTAVSEGSNLPTFLPKVIIVFLNCSHPSEYETVSNHGFNLHFPEYERNTMILSTFSCACWPFYTSLINLSTQCFVHFKIIFLFLSCNHSSYILDKSYLSAVWFLNIFWTLWLFSFLMVLRVKVLNFSEAGKNDFNVKEYEVFIDVVLVSIFQWIFKVSFIEVWCSII